MSAYEEYVTEFKDLDILLEALKEVENGIGRKWTDEMIEVHDEPVNLHGYRGDVRNQKAHIVIPKRHVQGSANDIGFEKMGDGTYRAHISEYDRGRYNDGWMGRLKQTYTEKLVTRQAKAHGYQVKKTKDKDKVKLRLQRWR